MATKLDTLFYEIEARTTGLDAAVAAAGKQIDGLNGKKVDVDVTLNPVPAEQGARRVKKSLDDTEKAAQKVQATLKDNSKEFADSFTKSALGVGVATASVVGLGAALLKVADDYQLVQNRLKLVTSGTEELAVVQTRLAEIANGTFQSFNATADLYSRLARSSKTLGLSQESLFQVTEGVSQAVKLSGVSAQAAEAGLVQLGQAFASGTLRGDELRSVLEQIPRLAEAIATGMGVTVGELRKLGEEGRLTSEQVAKAIASQVGVLREEAASVGPTLGQSFTLFTNAVGQYIADTNTATGATKTLGSVVQTVAENFDAIADAVLIAAAIYAGKGINVMVGKAYEFVAAELARARASQVAAVASTEAAVAAGAQAVAIGGVTTAAGAGAVAVTAFNRAVSFLGGPIGVAITAALVGITLAVDSFRDRTEKAREEAAKFGDALAKLDSLDKVRAAAGDVERRKTETKVALMNVDPGDQAKIRELTKTYQELEGQGAQLQARFETLSAASKKVQNAVGVEQAQALENVTKRNQIFAQSGEVAADAFTKAAGSFKDAADKNRSFAAALDAGDAAAKEHLAAVTKIVAADEAFSNAKSRAAKATREAEQAQEKFNKSVQDVDAILRDIGLKLDEKTKKEAEQQRGIDGFVKGQRTKLDLLDEELAAIKAGPVALRQFNEVQAVRAAGDKAVAAAIREKSNASKEELAIARELGEEEERRRLRNAAAQNQGAAVPVPKKDDLDRLVNAVGTALGAAQGLASAFGDAGDALADAAGKAENLVSALARARDVGKVIGKDGKQEADFGFTGAIQGKAGVAGFLGAAGTGLAVVGALKGLGDAVDLFGAKARQRAKEIAEATKAFNEGLNKLRDRADGTGSDVADQIDAALKEYAALIDQANKAFKGDALDREKARAGAVLDRERARIAADALADVDDALAKLSGNDAAARIREAARAADEQANGFVALRKAGIITQEQEAEAIAKVRQIFELTKAQIEQAAAEAEAARKFDAASREFAARAKLFEIEGLEYVQGLVTVVGSRFPELAGLIDGIDVSTADGLATLKERAKAIFEALAADGLTEAEQKIVDAMFDIIDSAERAGPALQTFADQVNDALSNIGRDNDILGGDARTRFGRTADAAKALAPQLAEILGDVDLSSAAGIDAVKTKLRALYTTLLVDGISDEESPIVDLIRSLLGGLDDVLAETEDAADTARERARSRSRAIIDAFDLEGADAFDETLRGYGDAFDDLFGAFDVTTIDGVNGAKDALRDLIVGIQDGTADLSAFGNLTGDEIIAILLDLDGTLDGLGDSAADAADRIREQREATDDFVFDLNQQFLTATDQGLEAVRLATEAWVADMIKQAQDLGVATEENVTKIRAIGAKRIADAERAEAERVARAAEQAAKAGERTTRDTIREDVARQDLGRVLDGETTAQRVAGISEISAQSVVGYLASSYVEQRAARVALEQIAGLLSVTAPTVAALPPGAGVGSAGGIAVQINVTVTGPITGQTAADAGRQLADAVLPYLNSSLARAAGIEAKLAGTPFS